MTQTWKSEDNLQKPVLSGHSVGSGDWVQVARLRAISFPTKPSHQLNFISSLFYNWSLERKAIQHTWTWLSFFKLQSHVFWEDNSFSCKYPFWREALGRQVLLFWNSTCTQNLKIHLALLLVSLWLFLSFFCVCVIVNFSAVVQAWSVT